MMIVVVHLVAFIVLNFRKLGGVEQRFLTNASEESETFFVVIGAAFAICVLKFGQRRCE
jgi:hypothetical protein